MTTFLKQMAGTCVLCLGVGLGAVPAQASVVWNWSYSALGISASGTFTTGDTPNGLDQYLIEGITGTRNGVAITGLQPTGVPIPGNEPFSVDNLLSPTGPQLTGNGFGFSLADGTFASVFFAEFLPVPGWLEILSAPPFVPGFANFGPEDSERAVVFSATPVPTPVPAPGTLLLLATALAALQWTRRSRGASPASC